MTDARLLTDRARPSIRLERHLPDPPEIVWRALTEREQLRRWFPCDVIVSGGRWEIGAAITFPFRPEVMDLTLAGEVLEVDEPNVLAFTWGEDALRFELSAEGRRHPSRPDRRAAARRSRSQRRGMGAVPRPARGP